MESEWDCESEAVQCTHITRQEGIEPFTVFLMLVLIGGIGVLLGQRIEQALKPAGPIVVKVELPVAIMGEEDIRDRSTSFSAMVDQGANR